MSTSKIMMVAGIGAIERLSALDLANIEVLVLAHHTGDIYGASADTYNFTLSDILYEPSGEVKKSAVTYGPPKIGKRGKIVRW